MKKQTFKFEEVSIIEAVETPAASAKISADQDAIAAFLAKKAAEAPAPVVAPVAKKTAAELSMKALGAAPEVKEAVVKAVKTPTASSAPKAPATMEVNGQNVPVVGKRKDDCYGCHPKDTPSREKVSVAWAMTWDDASLTTPIYICTACGRQAPRTIRNPK